MLPWQKNKPYIITASIILLLVLYVVLFYKKGDIHLFINRFHNKTADIFFKYITNLGDGIFVVVVSILLVVKKIRFALYSFAVYLASGIFVQLGKRLIWPDAPRPVKVFDEGILHLVDGIKMHGAHSFPSGHSASAFGLFFVLIFITGNKMLKWLFLICAMLTAFSRVYISLHFLVDILVGSYIGFLCAFLLYRPFINLKGKWLDKSLLRNAKN